MTFARRHFMLGAAAAATAGLVHPRGARAQWGAWPESVAGLQLPPQHRAGRVLELFFYGGLCPWDTFYCVPQWGQGEQRFLHAFDVAEPLSECSGASSLTRPFAVDSAGTEVHLGPWTYPLWERPDLLDRMRVVVTRHDQLPHETAIPLALTGSRLGSPQLASTGSAVQRYFSGSDSGTSDGDGDRVAPYAYVLHPGGEFSGENLSASTATGRHPVAARPWDLAMDQGPVLADLLERPAVAEYQASHDALLDLYGQRYRDRLQGSGRFAGQTARSGALDAWQAMRSAQRRSPQMASIVGPALYGLPLVRECGQARVSMPMTLARAAARLLRGEQAARHVTWIDGGLDPSFDGGHDSHRDHLEHAALNYPHTLRALASVINAPGEDDPDKIDLHDTLVVITTEFGRSPQVQDERGGLNHWPSGYVSVLIGGPIDSAAAGVVGSIDPQSAVAQQFITPAELRAGLLDAMGIYPFDAAAFGLGDLQGSPPDDPTAIAQLRRSILGVET